MTAEQKARDYVNVWGINGALKYASSIEKMYSKSGNEKQHKFWSSVCEHILKLKNEWK